MEQRAELPVCFCLRVSAAAITQSVREGARTLEAVRGATGAGAACTSCEGDVDRILCLELEAVSREQALLGAGHPDQLSLFSA